MPTRWGRSGIVMEVLPFRQCRIKVDGSGRLTVRNRVHLKPFIPPTTAAIPAPSPVITIPECTPNTLTPHPVCASTPKTQDVASARNNYFPRNPLYSSSPPTAVAPITHDSARSPTNPQVIQSTHEPTIMPTNTTTIPNDSATIPYELDTTIIPRNSTTIPYEITSELPVRQSSRVRKPPSRLSLKLQGKTHTG